MMSRGRPFGWIAAVAAGTAPAVAQGPVADRSAGKPAVFIKAPAERVHEAIRTLATDRGMQVAKSGPNGVTLERASVSTPRLVEAQCGAHQPGRVFRISFVTAAISGGTAVTEDRYMVDPGRPPCLYRIPAGRLDERNIQLDQLKRTLESSSGPGVGFPPLVGR